jgi:hypothetical protein
MSRRFVPLSLPGPPCILPVLPFGRRSILGSITIRWHRVVNRCRRLPRRIARVRTDAGSSALHCGMFQKEFPAPPCNVLAALPFSAHSTPPDSALSKGEIIHGKRAEKRRRVPLDGFALSPASRMRSGQKLAAAWRGGALGIPGRRALGVARCASKSASAAQGRVEENTDRQR